MGEGSLKKLIIIGGGPAGYVAALRAAQLGGQVTLIEKDEVGGTCLNRGCIPTKALLASAEVLEVTKNASKFGIRVEGVFFDFSQIMKWKEDVVTQLRKGVEYLLKKRGVNLIKAIARIAGPGIVKAFKEGKEEEYRGEAIIIATGSEPLQPSGFPFDRGRVLTSNEALSLQEVPRSLLIVGAGAIGVEFATIFNALGSKVTLVEMMGQILPGEDTEVAQQLEREFKKRGIEVLVSVKIEEMGLNSNGVVAKLSTGGELTADKALVCIGRTLNSTNLGLEEVGIATEGGRILVNERMETNVPGFYAIGDVVGGMLFAHKASAEGLVAVHNILGDRRTIDYKAIPRCIFTSPEIACVGLTEEQAKNARVEIKVGKFPFRASGKALTIGKWEGMVKVIAEAPSDRILGIHIIGPQATDLIAEGALAIRSGITSRELGNTIHAHPTLPEALMEASEAVHKLSIHIP